jgi:transcriptional regulator with XRE-family HTH domain
MAKKPIRVGIVANAAIAHFSTLLQIKRKEKKISVDELSTRLGISYPTTKRMLEGTATVAIGTYFEAAHILGVTLFEPEEDRFSIAASKSKQLESLLPQRIHNKKVELDDDF